MNKDNFDKIQAHIDNEINKDTFYWVTNTHMYNAQVPLNHPAQFNKRIKSDKHFRNIWQNTECDNNKAKTA